MNELISGICEQSGKKHARTLAQIAAISKGNKTAWVMSTPERFLATLREGIEKSYTKSYTDDSLTEFSQFLLNHGLIFWSNPENFPASTPTELGFKVLAHMESLAIKKVGRYTEFFLPSRSPNVHDKVAEPA